MVENFARRVYVITYSRANVETFPKRQDFADACVAAFEDEKCQVLKYACCYELHEDGTPHYHCAIKLSAPKRWKSARDYLDLNYDAKVNFSEREEGNFYNHAYAYVCKEDQDAVKFGSEANESMGSPRTKVCVKAIRKKAKLKRQMSLDEHSQKDKAGPSGIKPPLKRKRLSASDVGRFAVSNNIKTEKELYAIAGERDDDGNSDLYNFIMNNAKRIQDILDAAWKLHDARQEAIEIPISRIEVIRNAAGGSCVPECDGRWLTLALKTLRKNRVDQYVFAKALYEALEKGRGKHRNVMIIGPYDSGKTFMLHPLKKVFSNAFMNPSSSRFAWIGADTADVIFLNDYRWQREQISWSDLLRLLEEDMVCHLPAPMNHFAREITVDTDVAIFATSDGEIKLFNKGGEVVKRETDMMRARWKLFEFTYSIPEPEQIKLPPCGACFSRLVLIGESD